MSFWAWPNCFTAVGNILEMSISRPLRVRLKNECVHSLLQGLCLKPARLKQQAKPQNSSVLPSFPLQQGKAERGWNLKRCACRNICHSFVQEGCVEDTGESLMSYKLLHLFWHWHLGSLYPPTVFCNTSWAKGVCPPVFLMGCVPRTG